MRVNKIPKKFFITKGSGSSRYETHAGSYHMALYDAGISDYNIITYSSVLPPIAEKITTDDIDMPIFGSELKCIMSCMHGRLDDKISAGIAYAWLYSDKDMTNKIGGLVVEVSGHYSSEDLEKRLYKVLEDLHLKTYSQYTLGTIETIMESYTVVDNFGTCLVSMCFVEFE
jgi:arginine decarboxylase